MHDIMQLEISSYKIKWKISMVTSATAWYFIMYMPDKSYCKKPTIKSFPLPKIFGKMMLNFARILKSNGIDHWFLSNSVQN
jgi:hypothetical protein